MYFLILHRVNQNLQKNVVMITLPSSPHLARLIKLILEAALINTFLQKMGNVKCVTPGDKHRQSADPQKLKEHFSVFHLIVLALQPKPFVTLISVASRCFQPKKRALKNSPYATCSAPHDGQSW